MENSPLPGDGWAEDLVIPSSRSLGVFWADFAVFYFLLGVVVLYAYYQAYIAFYGPLMIVAVFGIVGAPFMLAAAEKLFRGTLYLVIAGDSIRRMDGETVLETIPFRNVSEVFLEREGLDTLIAFRFIDTVDLEIPFARAPGEDSRNRYRSDRSVSMAGYEISQEEILVAIRRSLEQYRKSIKSAPGPGTRKGDGRDLAE